MTNIDRFAALKKDAQPEGRAIIYGVEERKHESGDSFSIRYYGFKAGQNEVRVPTSRIFTLMTSSVKSQGEVTDFYVSETPVKFYEIELVSPIFETISEPILFGIEIAKATGGALEAPPTDARGGTIGSLVAGPATGRPLFSELEGVSVNAQLARVRDVVLARNATLASDPEVLPSYCSSYTQSYSWTHDFLWGYRLDPWGADCD
jgi:hypothetical protein